MIVASLLVASAASIHISGNSGHRDVVNSSICAQRFKGQGYALLNATITFRNSMNTVKESMKSFMKSINMVRDLDANRDDVDPPDSIVTSDVSDDAFSSKANSQTLEETFGEELETANKAITEKEKEAKKSGKSGLYKSSGFTKSHKRIFSLGPAAQRLANLRNAQKQYERIVFVLYFLSGSMDVVIGVLNWARLQSDVDESTSTYTVLNTSNNCTKLFAGAMALKADTDTTEMKKQVGIAADCIQKDMDKCVQTMFDVEWATRFIEGVQSAIDMAIVCNSFLLNIRTSKHAVLQARAGTDARVKAADANLHKVIYILCGREDVRELKICTDAQNKAKAKDKRRRGREKKLNSFFEEEQTQAFTYMPGECKKDGVPLVSVEDRSGDIDVPGRNGWKKCENKCKEYSENHEEDCMSYQVARREYGKGLKEKGKMCLLYTEKAQLTSSGIDPMDLKQPYCYVQSNIKRK